MYFGENDASERALKTPPARDEEVQPGEGEREALKEAQREFA